MALIRDLIGSLADPALIFEVTIGPPTAPLWPEEEAAVDSWTPQRRDEFARGRDCARHALKRLGVSASPILFDTAGAPSWPHGTVGSISHKRGCCLAVVGFSTQFLSMGVDLEQDCSRGEDAVVDRICSPMERDQISSLRTMCTSPGTLILSAKEAYYKFQFPLTSNSLDWRDVEVVFGQGTYTVQATDSAEAPSLSGVGRFAVGDGWLVTMFHDKIQ